MIIVIIIVSNDKKFYYTSAFWFLVCFQIIFQKGFAFRFASLSQWVSIYLLSIYLQFI